MNILIMGVGGQGALLAAKLIGAAAVSKGFDVKASEVHGMAKRGGSVETYVRYSREPIGAPIIAKGEADIILGLEALEALRGVAYLRKGGRVVMNTQEIDPMPVITGKDKYPENIAGVLTGQGISVVAVDALAAAQSAGSIMVTNVVMIGAMSQIPEFLADFCDGDWVEAIRASVKGCFLDINLRAFEAGAKLVRC